MTINPTCSPCNAACGFVVMRNCCFIKRNKIYIMSLLRRSHTLFQSLASVGNCQRTVFAFSNTRAFTQSTFYRAEDKTETRLCNDVLETPSPKVLNLADEVVALNLLEINQLMRYLQKRLGVPESFYTQGWGAFGGGGGGGGGAAQGGAAAAAAEPAKEKDAFDLKLTDVPAASKIKIIKEVRAITGLGLKEAKEMVEKSPIVVKQGLKKDEAEKLKAAILEAGGKAELL